MTDREKVIRAMECCAVGAECDHCPYSSMNQSGYEGCYQMHADALALLKAQEPMVLSLDDVRSLPDNTVVWLEDNDKPDVIPAIVNHVWNGLPNMVSFTVANVREVKADMLWYGTNWRCWTSRPTDEQREAVKWE